MLKIKVNLKKIKNEDLDLIVDSLRRGKVIVYPTDTVYGIGCLAADKKTVNKVFKIKRIVPPKPLIVLIKSYCMLHELCYVSKAQEKHIRNVWPSTTRDAQNSELKYSKQPTTFILKSKGSLPKEILGEDESLAVRLPKNDFLLRLLKKINQPIISTSLNITGRQPLAHLVDLDKYFKDIKPDLIIDIGEIKKTKPSKIVDLRNVKANGLGARIIR
ncbi:MAG: Threonylcarbamoyl-AMP synthase [Parcubacteria group bacterium ADurb.Bin316]|nr:MAG: Threonylcarbamoyl-AMP synthase [Parcubacteria group bacterium ADurb.Bin316]HOZ55839.1 L-threonylcarbamoyladenylate synthase [bacterium]